METPFADSTNARNMAGETTELSSVIADQILDKESFAASAQNHFAEWDKNKNRSLSLTELSDIYTSTEASYSERATASILAENFSLFSNMCAPNLDGDPNSKSYSKTGFRFLESKFAGDRESNGITPRDLDVASMLVSKDGQEKFVRDAESREKQHLGFNGVVTGLGGALTMASLGSLLTPGPAKFFSAALFGVNTLATAIVGTELFDGMRKNDLQLMEMQFKNRRAMLDSLNVPRL